MVTNTQCRIAIKQDAAAPFYVDEVVAICDLFFVGDYLLVLHPFLLLFLQTDESLQLQLLTRAVSRSVLNHWA